MKKLFSFVMQMCLCFSAQAQIGVFIYDDNGSVTNFRNTPGGKVVLTASTEGSHGMNVVEASNGWLRLDNASFYSMDEDENAIQTEGGRIRNYKGELWIHWSVTGVNSRNYGHQRLVLREYPNECASPSFAFTDEMLFRVVDVTEGWAKVRTLDKKHEGWIEEEWLCGNPVTNCV